MTNALQLFAIAAVGLAASMTVTGCATGERRDAVESNKPAADWELRGWRIIGCCCTAPCPCRINKKPTFCHGCDHTDVVHVDQGRLGEVAMDGVTWAMVGRAFGKDTNETWVYVYVDDDASDAQVEALKAMLNDSVSSLKDRAPFLAGKFVGLREVPMTVSVNSRRTEYDCEIPGVLAFETRSIFNPGHSEPVVSTGILDSFGDRFVHADALVHTLDDPSIGYRWNLTGRQANQADFVLNQAVVERVGLGWGCWSAHSQFGDQGLYGEEELRGETHH